MDGIYIAAVILAFAATTTAFLILYQRIMRSLKPIRSIKLSGLKEESLEKLREILSERRREDLRKLLSELREIELSVERVVNDGGEAESESGGDS
ncbi:MAG: hypothetical protein J7J94_01545 [Thaumarchaeota archaeon]|nr:hypothetical protein [Nitrososphaerota archaeon]